MSDIRIFFTHPVDDGGAQRLSLLLRPDQVDLEDPVLIYIQRNDSVLIVPWSNVRSVERPKESASTPKPKKGKKGE